MEIAHRWEPHDRVRHACLNSLSEGNGWLAITRFSPHPITKGLRRLGYQTGGRLDPRYSVAWTSAQAWADEWTFANDRLGEPADLRIVADGHREFSPDEIAKLTAYVRAGGKLIVLPHVLSDSEPDSKPAPPLSTSLNLSDAERTTTEHTTDYSFPNGGRVVLLADDLVLQCKHLAPAYRLPNAEEGERQEAVLKIVRRLLDDTHVTEEGVKEPQEALPNGKFLRPW